MVRLGDRVRLTRETPTRMTAPYVGQVGTVTYIYTYPRTNTDIEVEFADGHRLTLLSYEWTLEPEPQPEPKLIPVANPVDELRVVLDLHFTEAQTFAEQLSNAGIVLAREE